MTAKRLLCVGLPSLLIIIAALIVRAQDAPKTNDAAIEELKQEKQAAAAAVPVAEPKIEELLPAAEVKKPAAAVEAPKAEAVPAAAPAAPVIEELMPVKAEEKKPAPVAEEAPKAQPAAPVIEELAPVKAEEKKPAVAEAPKAEAAPAVPSIEELVPAKVEEKKPVSAPADAPVAVAPAAQPVGAEAQPVAGRTTEAEALANVEVVRRQADAKEGQMAIQDADKAWKDGDYVVALNGYKRVAAKLHGASADRSRALERIPVCEYRVALGLMKAGKNSEALAKVNDALTRFQNDKDLKKLKGRLEAILEKPVVGGGTGPTTKGDGELSEVDKQMLAGKRYLAARDYAKARASFESVLALDRDNREAMRYLKEVGDLRYNTATTERLATAAKMSAQVRDAWNPPQYRAMAISRSATNATPTPGNDSMLKKMEKIIIPEIEFRQANIHDVVDFLNKASIEADKTEPDPSKKGINIILNINPAAGGAPAAAAAAPRAGGDLVAGDQPAAGGGAGVPEITFQARYISMVSALKIITSVAGLKYRVDGNIVMIVRGDFNPDQIEVRMYPVEPTFIERVTAAREGMGPAPANKQVGGREVVGIDNPEAGGGVGDLKTLFDGMGVKFGPGSSIKYVAAIGKVIVANTSENLAIFEKLLAELNVVPKQVEIEARFVEVNETDLQELGLEWLLNSNWTLATKKMSPLTPLSATPTIQAGANAAVGGFTSGLRFLGTDNTGNTTAQTGGKGTLGNLLSISSILTNPDVTTILHALEQNGNADLLSAPKVTTQSGKEASIRVVTEYIYPTTFQVTGGTTGVGNNNAATTVQETVVTPGDFQTREVGVILTVTPEVGIDGSMINLVMSPSVVTDPTWFQYGSVIHRPDGSTEQLNMPQPFFHTRTLTTQISIYDGATVVMGGLITEQLTKVNDKVPVLGDIPLLGVLFRSQSEQSVKKNLLIFVTAKLVDPAGKVIRSVENEKAATSSPTPVPSPVASN